MGTSKRYAERVAHDIDSRILEIVARGQQPDSLNTQELGLQRNPLTQPPRAIPVRAWIHYGGVAVEVDAEAVAWTPRAVAIRWPVDVDGTVHRAWVWSSAVTAASPGNDKTTPVAAR